MTKLIVAIAAGLLVCALLWLWLAGGAQAAPVGQAGAFDRACVCQRAVCWVRYVDEPGTWVPVFWRGEVRLPDTVELWQPETDWRCGR
jgi:hypothetical protein